MIANTNNFLLARFKKVLAIVRLRPFDMATPEGRSNERYRRVVMSALASAVAKGISILTLLVSVPLTVNYLGLERYGLWMTLSSMVALLGFADLGMGNGLLNAISDAHGRESTEEAGEYVSSAFFTLAGLAVILVVLFALIYPLLPWQRIFNITSAQASAEIGPSVIVFTVCSLLSIPLGIVQRVQIGYQEGFVNSLWQGAGNILSLLCLLLVVYLRLGLPWLVLALVGSPVITLFFNSVVLFGMRRPWLRPRWSRITGSAAKRIFHTGILFFVLQIAVALAFSSDNIIITQILGLEMVAKYAVPARMFSVIPMISAMIVSPLWPAYGESITRGETNWVRKTLVRSLVGVLTFSSTLSLVLIYYGDEIVKRWVGPEVMPSSVLLLGLGLWTVLLCTGNAISMFLNGINAMKFQAFISILLAITAILFKIILTQSVGIPGIVWGTAIAYIVCIFIPYLVYVPKKLAFAMKSKAADEKHAY